MATGAALWGIFGTAGVGFTAVEIGLATVLAYTAAAIVINIAIASVLGKLLAPDVDASGRDTKGLQTTIRSNVAPRRVIYGECYAGGPYIFIKTDGFQNSDLHMVIAFSGHPIEDVLGVVIEDQYINISTDTSGNDTGTNDLDASYYCKNGKLGSTDPDDDNYRIVQIIKILGWGYADFQYVTDGNQTKCTADRARAQFINDIFDGVSRVGKWKTPGNGGTLTRDSTTGLYSSAVGADKLTNCSYIYLRLKFVPEIWGGFPQLRFHVKGKNLYNPYYDNTNMSQYGAIVPTSPQQAHDLNDPDTWEYSDDWTLCVLDYLTNNAYGLGAKTTGTSANPKEIDWAEAITSHLVSSELITNGYASPDTANVPRYTVNGLFEVSSTPISIMEAILTSGAGELVYAQGEYKIRPGIYRAPSSPNDIINENNIVSPITIRTHTPRGELFNKAAGVFVDRGYDPTLPITIPDNDPSFEPADFTIVDPKDSSGFNPYELIDGEEIIKDFDYPYTTDASTAQRLAKIQLERARRGLLLSFEGTLDLIRFSVGDTVYLEILSNSKYANEIFFNRLGLDNTVQIRPDSPFDLYYKQFKIIDMQYTENSTIAVSMVEEDPGIYDWNNGDASPNSFDLISGIGPIDTILPPSWQVSSPFVNIVEDIATSSGTTVTTLIRWSAPQIDSGSLTSIGMEGINSYRLEYGIVDNPSAGTPENRVTNWVNAGNYLATTGTVIQGPIALETLYKDGSVYDFRIRSISYQGTASVWAYYSVAEGSDYDPSAPPASAQGIRTVNIYNLNDSTIPSPQDWGTFAQPIDSTLSVDGWTYSVPSLSNNFDTAYVSTRTFTSDGQSPQDPTWSTPAIYSQRIDGVGKTASLTADVLAFIYDSNGLNPSSPAVANFTAASYNFNANEEYRFLVDDIEQSPGWTTSNTFVFNAPANYSSLPQTVRVEVRDNGSSVAEAADTVTVFGIKPGAPGSGTDAYTIVLSNEAHVLPTTSSGIVTYTGSGTTIDVYDGTTQLNSVSGTPTTGQYSVTPSVIFGTVTVGTPIDVSGNVAIVPDHTSMTTDNAVIRYSINIENIVTITKDQSLSKALQGVPGDDPVTINYTNASHSVPVSNTGVETWTGSGGLLRVWEGNTALTLNTNGQISGHAGLSNGEFQVDITHVSGVTLNEPFIPSSDTGTTFCSLGEWSGNLTGISVYRLNVYIQDTTGVQHTLVTDITLTPSFEGDAGPGWTHDIVFRPDSSSPFSPDLVEWTGGTIYKVDGTVFSGIGAGNTGNMGVATPTYVYFDEATPTALQTTTLVGNAIGQTKILIAVCEQVNSSDTEATFQVFGGRGGVKIHADSLVANSITANEVNANFYTGRTFTGGTFQTRALPAVSPFNIPRASVSATEGFVLQDGFDNTIFSVTDTGGGGAKLSITGEMIAALDTTIFSQAGAQAVLNQVGILPPPVESGGEVSRSTPFSVVDGTNYDLWEAPYTSPFTVYNTGLDVNTLEFTFSDTQLSLGYNLYVAPKYDITIEYSTNGVSGWTTAATWVIQGTATTWYEAPLFWSTFTINASRTTTFNPPAPFGVGDPIYYRVRADRYSGTSFNNPKFNLIIASEPISAGAVTQLDDLTDVTITSPFSVGQILRYNGGQWVNSTDGSALTALTAANISAGNLGSGVLPFATASSTASAFKVPFLNTTGNTNTNAGLLHKSTGSFTYNPSTDTLSVGTFSGSGASLTALNAGNISTGTLAIARGGTNITTYTTGDILYSSATNVLSKLPVGSVGQFLTVVSPGVPAWGSSSSTVAAADITAGNLISTVYLYSGVSGFSLAYKIPFLNTTDVVAGNYQLLHDNSASLTYNPALNTLSAGTFSGSLSGNATSASVASTVSVAASASTTGSILFTESATGNLAVKTDAGLTYNASTNALTATTFIGALSGNATSATSATNATNATNIGVTDAGADTTTWPLIATAQTGTQGARTDAGLTYNASTNSMIVGTTQLLPWSVSTTPVFQPNTSDTNSGFGWAGADTANIIAGGLEMMRVINGGTSATRQNISYYPFYIAQSSAAANSFADYGQLWVQNLAPNVLMFQDDTSVDRYVGMAQYYLIGNQTFDMNTPGNGPKCPNAVWYSDDATAYTLTLENSSATTFPVGAQMTIWNEGSGTLTITEGTTTTLYQLTGSGAPVDTTGGCTMGQGGYATLIRKSTTVYLIMGSGITP